MDELPFIENDYQMGCSSIPSSRVSELDPENLRSEPSLPSEDFYNWSDQQVVEEQIQELYHDENYQDTRSPTPVLDPLTRMFREFEMRNRLRSGLINNEATYVSSVESWPLQPSIESPR
jgi:hypothetical protein